MRHRFRRCRQGGLEALRWKAHSDWDGSRSIPEQAAGVLRGIRECAPELNMWQVTRAARQEESLGRTGRRHGPARNVFAEAMANTLHHARSGGKGAQHWWVAVSCDEHGRPACFAAVDAGVGVLRCFNLRQRA